MPSSSSPAEALTLPEIEPDARHVRAPALGTRPVRSKAAGAQTCDEAQGFGLVLEAGAQTDSETGSSERTGVGKQACVQKPHACSLGLEVKPPCLPDTMR